MATAIRTSALTKRYGDTLALDQLDLEVRRGVVLGYLGPNGAGKSTTIRMLVGLLRPTSGRAEVLGLDVVAERDELRRRVGYLAGEFVAYPELTAAQYLGHVAALRDLDDGGDVRALAERLGLDLTRRIGALSHGNRQKVGIVQAFMHRPELLVLDEPTTGLDPLVQRTFAELVREVRDDGRTVLLSSHVLDEVEHVADEVAILREGRLVEQQAVEVLRTRSLRRVEARFDGPAPLGALRSVAGVREVHAIGDRAHIVVEGSTADLVTELGRHRVVELVAREADLEEVFHTYYTTSR